MRKEKEEEIWKDIPSQPMYRASSHGRIMSRRSYHDVPFGRKFLRRSEPPVILKHEVRKDRNGAPTVKLSYQRKADGSVTRKSVRVAALILEAFDCPQQYKSQGIRYKDGNPINTRPDNLEWAGPQALRNNLGRVNSLVKSCNREVVHEDQFTKIVEDGEVYYAISLESVVFTIPFGFPPEALRAIADHMDRLRWEPKPNITRSKALSELALVDAEFL